MAYRLKVAAVQLRVVSASKKENVAHALALLETCSSASPRIICLPELFSTPYFAVSEAPERFELAETIPGPTTDTLGQMARQLHAYIAGSIFESDQLEGSYYNCAFLIAPEGTVVGKYRKVHCPFVNHGGRYLNEKYYFHPGNLGFPVFPLDETKAGMLICYDRSFPEAWRCLTVKGAELVLLPTTSSGWRSESWEFGLRTKALENNVFILAANRVGKETFYREGFPPFYGSSLIIGPLGNILAKADAESEQVISAELDFEEMAESKRRNDFLRDWRPEAYDAYARVYAEMGLVASPLPTSREERTPPDLSLLERRA
ncbi:MAG: Nitrilase/cyanide hydratase and apolipoprotein N-acyltransferase [Dehalococcoidales bacterium]|nr:Nitrilase/cyanide hydratase and apolipoprotein N-acyltransferase [Dehalococcoidales bacterium]